MRTHGFGEFSEGPVFHINPLEKFGPADQLSQGDTSAGVTTAVVGCGTDAVGCSWYQPGIAQLLHYS